MLDGEVSRSESLSRVSIEAGFTFFLLMTRADDQGRFEARPRILLAELYPLREDVSLEGLSRWLDELASEGLIHRYEVEGRRYLHFPTWGRYQRLRQESTSKWPAPTGCCESPPQVAAGRRKSPQLPARARAEAGSGKREAGSGKRKREEKNSDVPTAPRTPRSGPAISDWSLRCSDLLIELLQPVPGARIPPGARQRWAREVERLAREAPELAANEADPGEKIERAIRWALGPENLGGEFEVVIRSGDSLRKKWPQLIARARRQKAPDAMDRWLADQRAKGTA
jgi:hypothetical protein